MSFILDTCAVSELIKKVPDKNVVEWFEQCPVENLYIHSLTIGEIEYGIELIPDGKKKNNLKVWFDQLLNSYQGNILNIDEKITMRWGYERARFQKQGIQLPVIDGLIACTAIEYNYTLVTRNLADIEHTDVITLNPWLSD